MTTSTFRRAVDALRVELADHRAYLLPLRVFIGLGWLRAAAEKLINPGWYDGSELTVFLADQLGWSQEAFILAGVPDPSAFYIVIQLVLFFGGAGAVLGLDARRSRRHHHALLVASTAWDGADSAHKRRVFGALAVLSLLVAGAMVPYVSTLDPATVVEDPAMILVTLALFAAGAATVRAVGSAPRLDNTAEREELVGPRHRHAS